MSQQKTGVFTHLLLALVMTKVWKFGCMQTLAAEISATTYFKHDNLRVTDPVVNHTVQVAVEADCAQICTQLRDECDAFSVGPVTLSGGGGGGRNSRSCELAKADGNGAVAVFGDVDWSFFLAQSMPNGVALTINLIVRIFDCSDLTASGFTTSGVYPLLSDDASHPLSVKDAYCDMETDGGGWTMIFRRFDGSGNFNRNWDEYKQGFGDPSGEYWFGNEYLHYLTNNRAYKLRFDLEAWDGERRYAEYLAFVVNSEASNYRLQVIHSGGNTSNGFQEMFQGFSYHDTAQFSTYDRDNDDHTDACTDVYPYGGFWYKDCAVVSPMVLTYCPSASCGDFNNNIRWKAWSDESLKIFEMKMRPDA